MKIVIDTTVNIDLNTEPHRRYELWDKKYKDVQDDYVLQANEVFATDTEGLREMHHLNKIDYKRYRAGLQVFGNVDDTAWNTYPDNIKTQIVRENATTLVRVIDTLGQDKADEATSEFDKKSINNRRQRFNKIKAILLNNVSMVDAFRILSELKNWVVGGYDLQTEYIEHGVEGSSSQDPILGLYDYVDGTNLVGTDAYGRNWNYFAASGDGGVVPGIRHQTLTFLPSSSLNAGTLADQVLNVLRYGKKNP